MDNTWTSIDAGHISELTAERVLSLAGYTVLKPNRTRRYDLVIETVSGFLKIQVKTARYAYNKKVGDKKYFNYTCGLVSGGKPYAACDVDLFCVVNGLDVFFLRYEDAPTARWSKNEFPKTNLEILPPSGDRPIPEVMLRRRKEDALDDGGS